MYRCKTPSISSRKNKRVINEARRVIAAWRAESRGSRPYVRVKCPGFNGKVFIDDFHFHIDSKSLEDGIGRCRLIPCVRELLKRTTDCPVPTPHGNLMLEGTTPDGQAFRVLIRPEKRGGVLQSFHPTA